MKSFKEIKSDGHTFHQTLEKSVVALSAFMNLTVLVCIYCNLLCLIIIVNSND